MLNLETFSGLGFRRWGDNRRGRRDRTECGIQAFWYEYTQWPGDRKCYQKMAGCGKGQKRGVIHCFKGNDDALWLPSCVKQHSFLTSFYRIAPNDSNVAVSCEWISAWVPEVPPTGGSGSLLNPVPSWPPILFRLDGRTSSKRLRGEGNPGENTPRAHLESNGERDQGRQDESNRSLWLQYGANGSYLQLLYNSSSSSPGK